MRYNGNSTIHIAVEHFSAQSSAHAHISILNVNIVSTLSETSEWIQKKTKPVIKDVI